jgi:uncharacterized protein YjdB
LFIAACSSSSEPPAVATIEVTPASATRIVGESVQLSAAVMDEAGNILSGLALAWSSSAAGVASVSSSGLVTANGAGTAIITAASGNKSGIATITVLPAGVATVEVTPSSASRRVGESIQLSAVARDAVGSVLPGEPIAWSSSAASVASVSNSGFVTANAIGTATITAASGSRSGIATITVIPEPIGSIAVTPTSDTLLVGETVQLTPTVRDINNNVVTDRTLTWASANPTIASVSGTGLVTGVGDGVTTVTASGDGQSAAATIRVFGPCSTALAPPIAVGQTINGSLATTDCKLTDDTYADGYGIQVATQTNVQIDMTASFDTYLILLELLSNGSLVQRSFNDDVDPDDPADPNDTFDTNSRIVFTLLAGAQYFILANSFDPNVTGNYQLKVTATGAFIARQAGYTKPGKAPISVLLKAIRVHSVTV